MRTFLGILTGFAVGLAILVIGGAVFLWTFDWNALRGALGERAETATGRAVEV